MLSKLARIGPGCDLLVSQTIHPSLSARTYSFYMSLAGALHVSIRGVTYALACATVAENLAVVFVSSSDLCPSNDWAGETGSKEIPNSIVSWRWPEGDRWKCASRSKKRISVASTKEKFAAVRDLPYSDSQLGRMRADETG